MSASVLRTISFDLSQEGIEHAIHEVMRFQSDLKAAMRALVQQLTQNGEEIAQIYVAEMGAVDTGELAQGIYGIFDESTGIGYVVADAPHAIYVEFGTGIVGEGSPHPIAGEAGWAYDVNQHREGGWVYFKDDDGKFHWTAGMEARPFMYSTLRNLEEAAKKIGPEIIRNQLGGG